MLLQLPTELVQLVLHHCETQVYLQLAVSCWPLYTIATSCREVILRHLRRTPGKDTGYKEQTTRELYLLLRRRTAEQMFNARFNEDRTIYTFNDKVLDPSACSVCRMDSDSLMALVFKDEDKIYFCRLEDQGSIEVAKIYHCFTDALDTRSVKILKTVISPLDDGNQILLTVLIRGQDPGFKTNSDTTSVPSSFAKLAQQSGLQGSYFVLSYMITSPPDFDCFQLRICRIYEHDEFKANALAVADLHDFAISWEDTTDNWRHEVIFYRTADDAHGTPYESTRYMRYRPTKFVDEAGMWLGENSVSNHVEFPGKGPVMRLKFNDNSQLLYSHEGRSIFGYYHGFHTSLFDTCKIEAVEAHGNYCRVQHQGSRLVLSVDIPFFATHETYYDDQRNIDMCCWTYLSYAMTSASTNGPPVAYLLKSHATCLAGRCNHKVYLDRGRRLRNWEIVARLRHFPDKTNSLGNIFAASPRGTRIAVFNWDTLYVWALNPEEVLRAGSSDYYPDVWRWEDDGLIDLFPPLVRCEEAVCFQLMFTDEDTLVALTDRGVRTCYFGERARGKGSITNIDIIEKCT